MSAEVIDETTGEAVEMEVVPDAAAYVAKQDAALLDVQVSTAKQFPRSVQRFQSDLESWATLNQETAIECFFTLPRDGKQVVGPTIRFAELIQAAYGNIVVDSQIIEEGREFVVVNATCRDLERNIASRAQVRRNVLTREGKRYKSSMIETTIMAASAIARRNAIFQVVPKALWLPIYEKARKVGLGNLENFETRRRNAVKGLREAGVDMGDVKAFLGGKDNKDITADELLVLELKLKAIQEKTLTPEAAFPAPRPERPEEGRSARKAKQALEGANGKSDPEPPAPEDESQDQGVLDGSGS